MPSTFVLVAAAIVALAPKSHGPLLTAPFLKYADDEYGRDFLDTLGRVVYYMMLIGGVALVEKILG